MAKATRIEGLGPETELLTGLKRIVQVRMADLLGLGAPLVHPQAHDPATADLIHEVRVATRRLRAALSLCRFSPDDRRQHAKRCVAALGQALGRVRDQDIHLGWLRSSLAGIDGGERDGVTAILGRVTAARAAALDLLARRAADFFDGEAGELTGGMARWRTGQGRLGGGRVRRRLRKRVKCVRFWLGPALSGKADLVHRLRLQAKKLRYHAELLVDVVPPARDLAGLVAALQDGLGALHDCDARTGFLVTAIAAAPPGDLPGLAHLLRDVQHERDVRWTAMQAALARCRDSRELARLGRRI